jgi:regulator of sigma E protease
MTLSSVMGPLLLALGFGFVIFWHELGHFLAAKWVGIKVDQFAVGFGKAIIAWRKGIGFRVGSTTPDYKKRLNEWLAKEQEGAVIKEDQEISPQDEQKAADALGISETEYRLNWIPLGGYVKMLGQDDMNPNAQSADPRAFNRKSIGARMLVVSAGVIMNIIMAMIGFAIVFWAGFDAPPAVVGEVVQGSPAQRAGLHVGDRIAYIDDEYQHDFTKLRTNVVLAGADSKLKLVVERPDSTYETIVVTPERSASDMGFYGIGIGPASDLAGYQPLKENIDLYNQQKADPKRTSPDLLVIAPGETIVAVAGERLAPTKDEDRWSHEPGVKDAYFAAKRRNIATFDRALQASAGKPFEITVLTRDKKEESRQVIPTFDESPGEKTIRMAGLSPRALIRAVTETSPVFGKVLPGDVVLEIALVTPTSPAVTTPTEEKLRETLNAAGNAGDKVNLKVLRGTEVVAVPDIKTITLETKKSGLGVGLGMETANAVVGTVVPGSSAEKSGIPNGAKVTKVNNTTVANWFDLWTALKPMKAGDVANITTDGSATPFKLALTQADLDEINSIQLGHGLMLQTLSVPRQTNNPIKAMGWGVVETTSLLKQFYVSLQRMVDGTISPKNMMGPVGIFQSGTHFAERGNVWLIWFLCMISANLAVVNFLPIPIVDGGLFTFLIIEKIKGRPISAKTQTVAQIVGLAMLGFVFVFATWQDISRMIWGWG